MFIYGFYNCWKSKTGTYAGERSVTGHKYKSANTKSHGGTVKYHMQNTVNYICSAHTPVNQTCVISTSGMKGLPDTTIFPITKLYLMCILVHLTTSWTDICMSFVTWHLILFAMMHFLFPFHHHLHTSAYILSAQANKTPIINGWTLGIGVGRWDSEM